MLVEKKELGRHLLLWFPALTFFTQIKSCTEGSAGRVEVKSQYSGLNGEWDLKPRDPATTPGA